MGVKHGAEVEFTFGHPLNNKGHNYTEAERDLSLKMMKYFTDFAKTGYTFNKSFKFEFSNVSFLQ